MAIAISVSILGVCFFITTVNFYFQSSKYKYLTKDQRKKLNLFNSPIAWASYSFVIALFIAIIFITSLTNIMTNSTNVDKQQNTLIQQQQTDSTQQSTN